MVKSQEQNVHLRIYFSLLAILLAIALVAFAWEFYTATRVTQTPTQRLQSAQTAYESNNLPSAISYADAVLSNDPNNVQALIAKATALAQEGSLTFQEQTYGSQAIAVAQQALAIDPQNADAWRIIGYANEIMQNYPAAEQAYEKSLALDPKNALTLSQQAHSFDLQGETAQAESGYTAALALDPTLDQAEMGMGRIYTGQQAYAKALALFQSAASSTQNTRTKAEALYSSGAIESAEGNNAVAEQLFSASIAADPTYAMPLVGLAAEQFSSAIATSTSLTVPNRSDLMQQSMTNLQSALGIDPNLTIAAYQAGIELAAFGQDDQARQFFEEALRIAPNDITLSSNDKAAVESHITAANQFLSTKKI